MTTPKYKYKADPSKILNTIKRNPCATNKQIGDKYGVTGERIRQIKRAHGLPTTIRVKHLQISNCLNCGNQYLPKLNKQKFCSHKCSLDYHRVLISCDNCGKLFPRIKSQVIYKINTIQHKNNKPQQHFYCSPQCRSHVLGTRWGFATHPENMALGNFNKKHDYNKIYAMGDKGVNGNQISKRLGIPNSTVYRILNRRQTK